MAVMNRHLFVYGTLLSGARHPMGERLRSEASPIGEASIQGRLYSLGRYPGLVESTDAHDIVHGEVYALNNPTSALDWLDAYEGIRPGLGEENPYERVVRPVCLVSGATLTAWVYLYRKSVRMRPPVLGGHWIHPPE